MKIQYKKKDGTSGAGGQFYEIKLAMYFLLRGMAAKRNGIIDQFYLGTNVSCVNGFDDVVFKYWEAGSSRPKIKLLQAKHKDKGYKVTWDKLLSDSSRRPDFLVKLYLDAYLKNRSSFAEVDDLVLGGCFEDCEFILFTNASFRVQGLPVCQEDVQEFFGLDNQRRTKFEINPDGKVIDVLKVPYDFSMLLEEMTDWVKDKKIFVEKPLIQMYKNYLENYVLNALDSETSFKHEFLDGHSDLPEGSLALREAFLCKAKVKLKHKNDEDFINVLKECRISVKKGFGKVGECECKERLITELSSNDVNEFMENFSMLFDQPGEMELEMIIKYEMRLNYNLMAKEADFIYSGVYSRIQNWWKNECYYITGDDDWFEESIKSRKLIDAIKSNEETFKKTGLKYESNDSLKQCIEKNVLVNIIVNESTKCLYYAKIHQMLSEMGVEYMIVDAKSFLEVKTTAVEAFRTEYDVLVIVEALPNQSEEFHGCFDEILSTNSKKRLIFVGQPIKMPNSMFILKDMDVGFNYLKYDCREKILKDTRIRFQDQLTDLQTIVTPPLFKVITNEDLVNIITKILIVGKKMKDLGEVESYHITRSLKRQVVLNEKCLSDVTLKIITKSNALKFFPNRTMLDFKVFNENIQVGDYDTFLFNEPRDEYELLTKLNETHWIDYDNGNLKWIKSSNNLQNIRKYIADDHSPKLKLEDLLKDDNKFVIVSAEPGFGKSTLISSIAVKSLDQIWKYRIDLVNHTSLLSTRKRMDPLDFLRRSCEMNEFEFRLFEVYYKDLGGIILFFDGFDEISPIYNDVVLDMFRQLGESKVDKIWITTRTCTKELLENALNTLSYSLEPLTLEEQKQFLKLFWKRDDDCIEEILNKFSLAIQDGVRDFIGVPLQLQMLSELQKEEFYERTLNLYKIYDRFFEKKYYVVRFEEKVDMSHFQIRKLIEKEYKEDKIRYGKLAMYALFEEHLSVEFKDDCKSLLESEISEGKERTGIVSLIIDGKPKFVHRTYTEFFAASSLASIMEEESISDFLLSINFFDQSNSMLRKFFDYAICGYEDICCATLGNDLEKVLELSSKRHKARDRGGRTVAHLAASRDFTKVIMILQEFNYNLNEEDGIFSWSPLKYADKCHHWRTANLLLDFEVEPAGMCEAIKLIKDCSDGEENLLFYAIDEALISLAIVLIDIRPECVNFRSKGRTGKTAAHCAALLGHIRVLKHILDLKEYRHMVDEKGSSLLHEAASLGELNTVRFLIQNWKFANVNAQDVYSRTPLHAASEFGHYDIVKYLLECGAKADTVCKKTYYCMTSGSTPLAAASANGFTDVVRLLQDYKDNIS